MFGACALYKGSFVARKAYLKKYEIIGFPLVVCSQIWDPYVKYPTPVLPKYQWDWLTPMKMFHLFLLENMYYLVRLDP